VRARADAGEREAKQHEEAGGGGGERSEDEAGLGEREVEKCPRQGARRPLGAYGRGAWARVVIAYLQPRISVGPMPLPRHRQ
jgi:hypothetical protein